MDTDALVALVRRAPALAALREGPLDRRDLEERLGVSRPTVHRLTRTLDERGLVERAGGEFALTGLGEVIAETVGEFERDVEAARRIAPVFEAVSDHDPAIDPGAFAGATVTTAAPGNPYRCVERFMELVSETDTLRGVDPTAINPLHLDDIHARIVDGMETDAVFHPEVVAELLTSNPERAHTAFESGNLTLRVHDDLPFGLTLCDDRIGVGVYDDETGMLRTYVDTDAPDAREWAKAVYADYRAEATELTEYAALAQHPVVRRASTDDG